MATVTSGDRFEISHKAGTPTDVNLVGADDIAAYMLIDSVAISSATSKAVSTVNAAAPDSSSISQAKSQAVSAASQGSVADSKAISGSVNTSVADSKALSVSGSTSQADSKAVSVANSVPIITVVANSQNVSTADSKATSAGATLAILGTPGVAIADGATNNYGGLAAQIAGMSSSGLTLRFGPGIYILDWLTITTITGPLVFEGVGPETILRLKNNATAGLVCAVAGVSTASITFRKMTIDGNRANQSLFLDLIQYNGGPLLFEDIAFTSCNARAIYGTFTPFFRLRRFTVSDMGETTDAQLPGGCGLGYLPTMVGPVDIGNGRFVQATVSDTLSAPYGFELQGTAAVLLSGVIEDLYFEKYGHKGVANPIGCVDIYNYGSDVTVRGITGRAIAHSLVKCANGARMTIDAKVIGTTGVQPFPAVQYGAGVHSVTGDFPDPSITVKATAFTNGPVVNCTGTVGNEIKNPRITIDARGCFQAATLDCLDGAWLDIVSENATANTDASTSVVYIASGCKNQINVRADIKGSANFPVYATGANIDLHVLPGSRFENTPVSLQHFRGDSIRNFEGEGITLSGTAAPTAIWINGATGYARLKDCRGPSSTIVLLTATSGIVNRGHTWQTASATWDPPSLANATTQTTTVAVAACKVGDNVDVEFSLAKSGTVMWGDVLADGTVTVYHRNETGGTIDLASGTLTVRVRRG